MCFLFVKIVAAGRGCGVKQLYNTPDDVQTRRRFFFATGVFCPHRIGMGCTFLWRKSNARQRGAHRSGIRENSGANRHLTRSDSHEFRDAVKRPVGNGSDQEFQVRVRK